MSGILLSTWIKNLCRDSRRRSKATNRRKPIIEILEDRLTPSSWNQFNGNAQHTGISTVAAGPTDQVLWSTSISTGGAGYFWHTGEPVFTPNDTVIVPVLISSSGQTSGANYELEAFNGATGALMWTVTSNYVAVSNGWLPPYQPAYDPVMNRVYFAGPGGTLEYISNPDNPGSSTPTPTTVAFYGTASYNANPSGYYSSIYVDTQLTVDNAGNVFFGFYETGSNPSGINDGGIARISAAGVGSSITAGTAVGGGTGAPCIGSAPALSNDWSTLYVAIPDSNGPYLVGVHAATMLPEYSVELSVPNSDTGVSLEELSTASPMVGPDGTVFMGVFSDGDRGFMTHYSANLATETTPGAFGWDDTASVIPASMVPSYTGTSTYLIVTKYNNYVAGETGTYGGNGVNEIAVLDPNASQTDPNNDPNPSMLVMKQIMTVTSPTEDSGYINNGYPDATREWCTNGTAIDPATDSLFINNEDGYSYRWNLGTNTITQAVDITNGYGEPYTPTSIGPNGVVYALNGGTLFALGGYSNYTLTNATSQSPAVVGQPVTFTTTLASTSGGAVPGGSIAYSYTTGTNTQANSTPVSLGAAVPLVNGEASLTTSTLLPGHYHIIATYSGGGAYAAGSTVLVQAILANPTVTLSASPDPSTSGQSVTLTATVNPNGNFFVPLGTVSFMNGSTLLGTVALNQLDQSTTPSSSQTATLHTSSLPAGVDSLTAVYSGDLNFNGGVSNTWTQDVSVPTVTSPTDTNITATSALLGGNVTSSGGSSITDRGVVYALTSANSSPTIGATGCTKVSVGGGSTGVFTANVTTVTASSAYSFVAYATNANGTTYSSVATFKTDPSITAVVINQDLAALYTAAGQPANGVQRSMVNDIVYTFSEPVNITSPATDPNVFTIAVASSWTGTVPTLTWAVASGSGGTEWDVTFSGNGVTGNSIANGAYTITVNHPSAITAVSGNEALSLAAGVDGANQSFYRLFGDINGDGVVNNADNVRFKQALANYNAAFDFDNDAAVNNADNVRFKQSLSLAGFSGFTSTV